MQETFTVKIEDCGRITLPHDLCQLLKLETGDELEIEADEHQIFFVRVYRSALYTEEVDKVLEARLERMERKEPKGEYHQGMEPLRKKIGTAKVSAAGAES